jgi:hypothetical protein
MRDAFVLLSAGLFISLRQAKLTKVLEACVVLSTRSSRFPFEKTARPRLKSRPNLGLVRIPIISPVCFRVCLGIALLRCGKTHSDARRMGGEQY